MHRCIAAAALLTFVATAAFAMIFFGATWARNASSSIDCPPPPVTNQTTSDDVLAGDCHTVYKFDGIAAGYILLTAGCLLLYVGATCGCCCLCRTRFTAVHPMHPTHPTTSEAEATVELVVVVAPSQSHECCICLDPTSGCNSKEQEVVGLKCGHAFHRRCITEWLRVRRACPLCGQ